MKIAAKFLMPAVAAIMLAPMIANAQVPMGNGMGVDVPGSVKDVVEKLNTATNDLTLEDLNAAREAVAKLDVLLDIEKKLTDLAKIRQERDQSSDMGALTGSLPMSALAPPPAMPANYVQEPIPAPAPQASSKGPEKVDILRISGAAGRYVAFYKENGEELQLRRGDKMPDKSRVFKISPRGVVLVKGKKSVTLPVKGVGKIFGAK